MIFEGLITHSKFMLCVRRSFAYNFLNHYPTHPPVMRWYKQIINFQLFLGGSAPPSSRPSASLVPGTSYPAPGGPKKQNSQCGQVSQESQGEVSFDGGTPRYSRRSFLEHLQIRAARQRVKTAGMENRQCRSPHMGTVLGREL